MSGSITPPLPDAPPPKPSLPDTAPPRKPALARFSFYHKDTGVFAEHSYAASEPQIEINTPADHVPIEGVFHPLSHRFDLATGVVVRADPPSTDHRWSEAAGRWELRLEVVQRQAARSSALAQIASLEASQARPLRELALDPANAAARERLTAIDAQIAATRGDLA